MHVSLKTKELYAFASFSQVGESTKTRGSCKSRLLSRSLHKAAKELRDNDNIVIRKADKSAIYVIMDKSE